MLGGLLLGLASTPFYGDIGFRLLSGERALPPPTPLTPQERHTLAKRVPIRRLRSLLSREGELSEAFRRKFAAFLGGVSREQDFFSQADAGNWRRLEEVWTGIYQLAESHWDRHNNGVYADCAFTRALGGAVRSLPSSGSVVSDNPVPWLNYGRTEIRGPLGPGSSFSFSGPRSHVRLNLERLELRTERLRLLSNGCDDILLGAGVLTFKRLLGLAPVVLLGAGLLFLTDSS